MDIINTIFSSENVIEFTVFIFAVSIIIGVVSGFIDATVGGGGLIAFPCLVFLGLPPHIILGTNKFQALCGTISSTYSFHKKKLIDMKALFPWAFILTIVWSIIGTILLKHTSDDLLQKIIPIIMVAILLYKVFNFKHGVTVGKKRLSFIAFIAIFTALLGFYDGFFGPGVGALWIFAFITFLGMDSLKASANTKLLNLASNIGSLIVLIPSGLVCYKIGLTMGVGQIIGAKIGVYVSVKKGAKFINVMFITIMFAMVSSMFYIYYL